MSRSNIAIVVLVLALGYFAFTKFVQEPGHDTEDEAANAVPQAQPADSEAHALYLQARTYMDPDDGPDDATQAETLLKQALELDPGYGPAWTALGATYVGQALRGWAPRDEALGLAREASEKALAIDADDGLAHANLGWIALGEDDLAAAARHFERAMELEPTGELVAMGATQVARRLGRLDQAVELAEYAVAQEPTLAMGHYQLSRVYRGAERYDEAEASIHAAMEQGMENLDYASPTRCCYKAKRKPHWPRSIKWKKGHKNPCPGRWRCMILADMKNLQPSCRGCSRGVMNCLHSLPQLTPGRATTMPLSNGWIRLPRAQIHPRTSIRSTGS